MGVCISGCLMRAYRDELDKKFQAFLTSKQIKFEDNSKVTIHVNNNVEANQMLLVNNPPAPQIDRLPHAQAIPTNLRADSQFAISNYPQAPTLLEPSVFGDPVPPRDLPE